MSKIAIVSNAEEGVVIDISGCDSSAEAMHYLTSTLQVSSRFWDGLTVDLNLGRLALTAEQVDELLSIVRNVGVDPSRVVSSNVTTVASLYHITKKKPVPTVGGEMAVLTESPWQSLLGEHVADSTDCCADLPSLSVDGQLTSSDNAGTATVGHAMNTVALAPASVQVTHTGEALVDGISGDVLSDEEPPVVAEVMRAECVAEEHATVTPEVVAAAPVTYTESLPLTPKALVAGMVVHGTLPEGAVSAPSSVVPALTPVTREPEGRSASNTVASAVKGGPRHPGERPGVLYLRQTLRSGQAVSHKGDLVIIGDVNPGAEVSAEGDITIWGALRGVAHAGTAGNAAAEIRALKFDPIQLRIAHAIARAPDRSKVATLGPSGPETARIFEGKIRISVSDPD